MRGDGTPAGTEVTIADPATGTILRPEPFEEFDRRHGGRDPVAFGVGILHY